MAESIVDRLERDPRADRAERMAQGTGDGVAVVVGFYATIVVVMTGMVLLFAAAKTMGPQARKNLVGLSSIALAGLGLYQLLHPWIFFIGEN